MKKSKLYELVKQSVKEVVLEHAPGGTSHQNSPPFGPPGNAGANNHGPSPCNHPNGTWPHFRSCIRPTGWWHFGGCDTINNGQAYVPSHIGLMASGPCPSNTPQHLLTQFGGVCPYYLDAIDPPLQTGLTAGRHSERGPFPDALWANYTGCNWECNNSIGDCEMQFVPTGHPGGTHQTYTDCITANAATAASKAAVGSGTPSTQTLPDTAATGSSTEAARLDHVHTMPAVAGVGLGMVLALGG